MSNETELEALKKTVINLQNQMQILQNDSRSRSLKADSEASSGTAIGDLPPINSVQLAEDPLLILGAREGTHKGYLSQVINMVYYTMYKVGRPYFTTDPDDNPASTLGFGEWSLVESGVTILTTQDPEKCGTVSGDNNQDVPLARHDHSATFSGEPLEPHQHDYTEAYDSGPTTGDQDPNSRYTSFRTSETSSVSAGTPSGTVDISYVGESSPTIDVSGRGLHFFVWMRTA